MLPQDDQIFLKNLNRVDEEGNIIPKPRPLSKKLSSKLKHQLLPGEEIILEEPVEYSTFPHYHQECAFVITDKRLLFIDLDKQDYSFAIPIADLTTAQIIAKNSGEFIIDLDDERKYRFSTSGNWYEAEEQKKSIIKQLKNISIDVID